MAWLALVIVLVACGLFGRLAIELLAWSEGTFQGDKLAQIYLSITFGIIVFGWLALLLAEVGVFSLWLVGLLWLVLVLTLLGILARKWRSIRATSSTGDNSGDPPSAETSSSLNKNWHASHRLEYGLLLLWLVGACWLFFRPHQYVLGAADAGVYVNLAASIADTGGILIDDPTLAQLDDNLRPALLRQIPGEGKARDIAPYYILPGFFVATAPPGRIIPQFYPLHPVWQALGHSIGGVQAALLMPGLWALLGALAVYLITRELSNWPIALLILVGLSLSALQVWFARYPTTEMLTQYLLWAGLWATMLWLKNKRSPILWGLVGGLALGQVFLVRIDAYFLLAVPAALYLWLRLSRRWQHQHWFFFIPIVVLTGHSLIHALTQSGPYFFTTFGYVLQVLMHEWWLPAGLLITGLALLLIIQRYRDKLNRLARFQRTVTYTGVALVLFLVLYGWFIRPYIGGEITNYDYWYGGGQLPHGLDRENLLRLGWYLSPLGIALATAGICQMILTIDRQKSILLGAGLIFSLLYLWRIQANPHQIYTMRRYVPAVLPFAMVATGVLFDRLSTLPQKWQRSAALLLAAAWLAGLVLSARGFIRQVDYAGLLTQLTALDEELEPASILIFKEEAPIGNGDVLGTPLHFLYGQDVYRIHDWENLDQAALASQILRWQAADRSVYWIGDNSGFLAEYGIQSGQPFQVALASQQLEGRYDQKPRDIVEYSWEMTFIPLH